MERHQRYVRREGRRGEKERRKVREDGWKREKEEGEGRGRTREVGREREEEGGRGVQCGPITNYFFSVDCPTLKLPNFFHHGSEKWRNFAGHFFLLGFPGSRAPRNSGKIGAVSRKNIG